VVGKVELKDMILSTLAELEDDTTVEVEKKTEVSDEVNKEVAVEESSHIQEATSNTLDDEIYFCESMRERILGLFEGFQSPNNKSIEAKVDLTLNFLEYSLAVLDERLEKLDNR
jgi:hypothetical protein